MKYFKHGDLVTKTDLDAMITAINAIEEQTNGSSYILAGRDAILAGTVYHGHHRKRWLMYRSTGEIYDIADPTNEDKITVLPDCDAAFCIFDLHTVPWLKYGMIYAVEGSEFALEADVDA